MSFTAWVTRLELFASLVSGCDSRQDCQIDDLSRNSGDRDFRVSCERTSHFVPAEVAELVNHKRNDTTAVFNFLYRNSTTNTPPNTEYEYVSGRMCTCSLGMGFTGELCESLSNWGWFVFSYRIFGCLFMIGVTGKLFKATKHDDTSKSIHKRRILFATLCCTTASMIYFGNITLNNVWPIEYMELYNSSPLLPILESSSVSVLFAFSTIIPFLEVLKMVSAITTTATKVSDKGNKFQIPVALNKISRHVKQFIVGTIVLNSIVCAFLVTLKPTKALLYQGIQPVLSFVYFSAVFSKAPAYVEDQVMRFRTKQGEDSKYCELTQVMDAIKLACNSLARGSFCFALYFCFHVVVAEILYRRLTHVSLSTIGISYYGLIVNTIVNTWKLGQRSRSTVAPTNNFRSVSSVGTLGA